MFHDNISTLFVPAYEKGNFIGLGSTKLLRGIKNDPDFQAWRQWLRPGDVLFNSEVGMVEQIRWIEVNNTSALSNAKASGVLGEGLVFGDDGVALAEVETPELRAAIPGNFGRYQAVAWYSSAHSESDLCLNSVKVGESCDANPEPSKGNLPWACVETGRQTLLN